MGYDLHITRKENWFDEHGPTIGTEEWKELASDDPEMQWMHLSSSGDIIAKNPDTKIIIKMYQLAQKLGAKVQGDEGEFYDASGKEVGTARSQTIYWPGIGLFVTLIALGLTGISFWFLGLHATVALLMIPASILVLSGFLFLIVRLIHKTLRKPAKWLSKKRFVLAGGLLLSAFALSPCHANLGDTLAMCEQRYGPPVPGMDRPDPSGVGDVLLTFKKNGYVMHAVLVRGYVGGESFAKADGSALADKEKSALMDAEAHGWAWAKNTAAAGENWLRTDGAVAAYVPAQHFLVLESKTYLAAVAAKEAAKADAPIPR